MNAHLIVMLTHSDKTVTNARKVFESACDIPVDFWGFKDVGLPRDEMVPLVRDFKDAKKKVFLEVVSYSEAECMRGAELAVNMQCDYLMGTLFYPSVWAYLRESAVTYLPFVGRVSGSPSILEGTARDMIEEARKYMALGVEGFDILAFRQKSNPEMLARKFVAEIPAKVVIAGSIGSYERMQFVEDIGSWGFTMGSALFDKAFVPHGEFSDNLKAVVSAMNNNGDKQR
jgi:hypothetical protein